MRLGDDVTGNWTAPRESLDIAGGYAQERQGRVSSSWPDTPLSDRANHAAHCALGMDEEGWS